MIVDTAALPRSRSQRIVVRQRLGAAGSTTL
jgi:hypothetical protein